MGLMGFAAAAATFRTVAGTVGILMHLGSYPVMIVNPPLGIAMHTIGDAGLACVVAPPGVNPLENGIVVSVTVASGPL